MAGEPERLVQPIGWRIVPRTYIRRRRSQGLDPPHTLAYHRAGQFSAPMVRVSADWLKPSDAVRLAVPDDAKGGECSIWRDRH